MVGERRKERWDRGSNLWGVSPMPDEIHHCFDEKRPWGADLMGGIGRRMAPIYRSILFRVPHHWKDLRIIKAGGSGKPFLLNLNHRGYYEKRAPHLLLVGVYVDIFGKSVRFSKHFKKSVLMITTRGEMEDGWWWMSWASSWLRLQGVNAVISESVPVTNLIVVLSFSPCQIDVE